MGVLLKSEGKYENNGFILQIFVEKNFYFK